MPNTLWLPSTAAHQASLLHGLLEFAQTHVHWIGDVIQPSHPLSIPTSPALSLSQHQGLFQWVRSSYQVAKVLKLQLQHQSNIQSLFPLRLSGLISLLSKGHTRIFSSTTIWKLQFIDTQLFLWSNSYIHTWLSESHSFESVDLCWQNVVSSS